MYRPLGPAAVALITGFDDEAGTGGIFQLDDGRVERLDDLASTGLAVQNDTLARVLRASDEETTAELLLYGPEGLRSAHRVHGAPDPHDLVWTDAGLAMVAAGANKIVSISADGHVTDVWVAPGEGDAWHLNSLLLVGGDLHVSAFGRFDTHREWTAADLSSSGFVMNIATGVDVVTRLTCPHHPRRLEDGWLVCNSAPGELLRFDMRTGEVFRTSLEGWTRGVALLDDVVLVGESRNRKEPQTASATVAVVDRTSWETIGRIEVPIREIYDIVVVPRALAAGVTAAKGQIRAGR
ncbi:MAG: DUF4915 domain-containing protein [Actinomycetota bacterium]